MEIVVRSTVLFFFLWAVVRGVGKRELSEMTAFELILVVTMGDLIQQGVTQEDMSLTGAFMAVGTIAFWILVTSYLAFRFPRVRDKVDGVPVVVVRDGVVLEDVLHIERIVREEVVASAREHGIAEVADIEIGVLEPDGKFSFLTRREDGASQMSAGTEKHKG